MVKLQYNNIFLGNVLTFCITVTFAPKSDSIVPTKGTGARPENSNMFNPFNGMLVKI